MSDEAVFYGRCNKCGRGMAVRVESLTGDMLGPSMIAVCQQHFPVGEADCVRIDCVRPEVRQEIERWLAGQSRTPFRPGSV